MKLKDLWGILMSRLRSRLTYRIPRTRVFRVLRPESIGYQLLSRALLILSGLLILIGVFQYVLMSHFLYKSTADNIRSQIHSVSFQFWLQAAASESMAPTNHHQIPPFGMPDSQLAFIDQKGDFYSLFGPQKDGATVELPKQDYEQAMARAKGISNYQIATDSRGHQQLVVIEPIGPDDAPVGVLQVSLEVRHLRAILFEQLIVFIGLSLGALIAGLFTFLPIIRRTLVPLSRMVSTVKKMNAGNLDERFATQDAQLEIKLLADSFNDMLERLRVSFEAERDAKEKMRQFVADASHELRTPLTSIHGFLEVLLRGAATNPEQLDKALRSMYMESERLTKLVHDLLLLARLDREPSLQLQEERLDLILLDMEPQLRLLAGEREVTFDIENGVTARIDKDKVKQVILNLFQNAVQHTDAYHGRIRASLTRLSDGIRITVQDNGPGIPEGKQAKLFERFFRIDSARSRHSGGAGLGLAITKAIVESHGGTVACESTPGHGALFYVLLPAKP